jgi:hypothetical protein
METGRERVARMKEYTSALLKVLKAGKVSVADAERYVAEAERLLRAETVLGEQKWPEGELPSVMKEIKEGLEGGAPSREEIVAVRKLLDSVRKEIDSREQ